MIAGWIAFALFAAIAVLGALGMTTTMGMFRSAMFLMASFFGVAGLLVLLSADLLAWLVVMMYVGGMLVMVLFMVLMSHDPGGDMMAGMMKLSGPEKLFSLGLVPAKPARSHETHGDHAGPGERPAEGGHEPGGEGHEHGAEGDHGGHGGMDMDMFTPAKRWAMGASAVLAAALIALLFFRPAWPTTDAAPDPASARRIGHLLMGRYMIAFEGAGVLILLGVFGGVLAARPGRHTGARARERLRAAAEGNPEPIDGALRAEPGTGAEGDHERHPGGSAP